MSEILFIQVKDGAASLTGLFQHYDFMLHWSPLEFNTMADFMQGVGNRDWKCLNNSFVCSVVSRVGFSVGGTWCEGNINSHTHTSYLTINFCLPFLPAPLFAPHFPPDSPPPPAPCPMQCGCFQGTLAVGANEELAVGTACARCKFAITTSSWCPLEASTRQGEGSESGSLAWMGRGLEIRVLFSLWVGWSVTTIESFNGFTSSVCTGGLYTCEASTRKLLLFVSCINIFRHIWGVSCVSRTPSIACSGHAEPHSSTLHVWTFKGYNLLVLKGILLIMARVWCSKERQPVKESDLWKVKEAKRRLVRVSEREPPLCEPSLWETCWEMF